MIYFYIFIFLVSCFLLYFAGGLLIGGLMKIARYFGWREFVVAFLVMAFAASLPNLFLGILSAFHKVPQLSFGDVVGGNVVDLTLVIAISVLVAGGLPVESRLVQTSSVFTIFIALLPLLLILDGILGRGDGIVLISAFLFYIVWLFGRKERFTKIYEEGKISTVREFKVFLKSVLKIILSAVILLAAAEGIIRSAKFFASSFNLEIALVGILVVGLGNAIPEAYFAVLAAKKGQVWMVLGDLMGSIVVPSTLVLGVVALIQPIEIPDFSPFAIARFFLVVSAVFFFFFVRSDRRITKKEAFVLLGIYVLFLISEIFFR